MRFKMPPAPPEVEKEVERLLAEWCSIGDPDDIITEDNDFDAYCKQHGSKALHDYEKMCDEIRSRLEPGEYV